MDFTEEQLNRYARHILLPEVGGDGQAKLLNARVLVVGAGGLGAPVLMYLAAAGIGKIGIIDDDVVDLSNLQRQIIHTTQTIDVPKVESAKERLLGINPHLDITTYQTRLNADNIMDIIKDYDVVADGTDNFATRFLLNDACYLAKKTLVSAAILRFDGQLSTYKAHEEGDDKPCYRCIFREAPPEGQVPTCSEAGVLGAICGTMGSLQATEVLKEVMGVGQSMSGTLMIYDALHNEFRNVKVKRDAGCPLCGDKPTITDLSSHT
ncbi:molybdopterin-synthase adenylyltransferase MoeB [Terasakiella sp. A23]|uniref:HesA/MoeB/ThiF family protein n=1 Tax=Terasakiella sp. FCG-A23 TaxID=3080561 RepID=UPI00295399A5|nr:molybdopterin-synthase adenylyltransferase MoeB [Terasakiella sp. A23]MDV7340740.1 molybdopterin-synthase adenylyltransferase MoeB [Terasakiella sp. A23]